jgi:actin-related protein
VKVIAPPERRYAAWIGAAWLALQDGFRQLVITRQEYQDQGPGILRRKCFF